MKTTVKRLRSLIESILTEAACPECGDPTAYIGMNDVECPNKSCGHFSKRQASDVLPNWDVKRRRSVDERNQDIDFINDHRRALGHPELSDLTDEEIDNNLGLIDKHAPYGNDPWGK